MEQGSQSARAEMKKAAGRRPHWTIAVSALAFIALMVWSVMRAANHAAPPRQTFSLVASAATFNGNNPTLQVPRGAEVEITIENKDSGAHHFIILGIEGTDTGVIQPGGSRTVKFRAATPGAYKYTCVLHLNMMSGEFIVQQR
ncbi:MAG: cupredoxin domain-containing protein [bacterium]